MSLNFQHRVNADWLADHLGEVAVVDTRWYLDDRSGKEAYVAGHIPTAVFADLDTDLSAPPGPTGHPFAGRHPLPAPEHFAKAMSRLGIGDSTAVVAYDDMGGMVAARLWWMLRVLGSPVAILDGGIAAWQGELSVDMPEVQPASFTPRPFPLEFLTSKEDLQKQEAEDAKRDGTPEWVLLDARPKERYLGQPNPIDKRFGHIPGAKSAPWAENLAPSGNVSESPNQMKLRPVEEIAEHYRRLGVRPSGARPQTTPAPANNAIAYCGSGVSACLDLLSMEAAGLGLGRLYPGSWSAWESDPTNPIEM